METDKTPEKEKLETTELQIKGMPQEEKKRFRVLCASTELTSAKMLVALMDRWEGKEGL